MAQASIIARSVKLRQMFLELREKQRLASRQSLLQRVLFMQLRAECRRRRPGLRSALRISGSHLAQLVNKYVTVTAAKGFALEMEETHRSVSKWTKEDMLNAITVYKRGRACYVLLQKMLRLPTQRCIRKTLSRIPLKDGIQKDLFRHLAQEVRGLDAQGRLCALLFDETRLSRGFFHDKDRDKVMGYVDLLGRSSKRRVPASRALVFMARGLLQNWKQPVAYFFCTEKVPPRRLKSLIIRVIKKLQSAGLRVVATVCDQGGRHLEAVRLLREPGECYFTVGRDQVFTLWDAPHLLKSTRDLMRRRDIMMGGHRASWGQLVKYFKFDRPPYSRDSLTAGHVYPDGRRKLNVRIAAQALSYNVGSTIYNRAVVPSQARDARRKLLTRDAHPTAHFIVVMDKLFDSFNGSLAKPLFYKPLRCCLTNGSEHLKFWDSILGDLDSCSAKATKGVVADQVFRQGWAENIRTVRAVWKALSTKFKVRRLPMTNLELDPLENLFYAVRQPEYSREDPTCQQFATGLKVAMVCGLRVPKARTRVAANCREDGTLLLCNLRCFLKAAVRDEPVTGPTLELFLKSLQLFSSPLNDLSFTSFGGRCLEELLFP